jgi:hypothetical protein
MKFSSRNKLKYRGFLRGKSKCRSPAGVKAPMGLFSIETGPPD